MKTKHLSQVTPPIREGQFFRAPALGAGQFVRTLVLAGIFAAAFIVMFNNSSHAKAKPGAGKLYAQLDLGKVSRPKNSKRSSAQKKKSGAVQLGRQLDAAVLTLHFAII